MAAVLVIFCAATARAEEDELGDLLEGMSFWEQFYTVRAGLGYSDNILFSDSNQTSSAMLVSGFDASIIRLPLDGTEITLFASLDDRRYFDGGMVTNQIAGPAGTGRVDDVRGERTFVGLAEVKRDLSSKWQVGLGSRYFYQDQVVDLSVTDVELSTLPVKGHQISTSADAGYRFGDNKRLRVEFDWQRQIFEEEEVDDYSEYGPKLEFGIDLPRGSAVGVTYRIERRDYDTRQEYGIDGIAIDGTRLNYLSQTAELEWKHHFDEAKHWRLTSRAGIGRNDDSGSGYFNYERCFAVLQLRYRNRQWEWEARARLTWYHYDEQLSDEHPGELRERVTTQASLRAERRLGRAVHLFAEYEFEQAQSNLSYDAYTVNGVNGGIDWSF